MSISAIVKQIKHCPLCTVSIVLAFHKHNRLPTSWSYTSLHLLLLKSSFESHLQKVILLQLVLQSQSLRSVLHLNDRYDLCFFSHFLLRRSNDDDDDNGGSESPLVIVTRFGEILPLWHNFINLGQIFKGEFSIWQKIIPFWQKCCDWPNFHCFKWPNILK